MLIYLFLSLNKLRANHHKKANEKNVFFKLFILVETGFYFTFATIRI